MITNEEAEKKFNSNDVMEAEPAGIRRVIMPAYGFAGASPHALLWKQWRYGLTVRGKWSKMCIR